MTEPRRRKSRAGWTEVKTMPMPATYFRRVDSEVEEPPDLDSIETQIQRVTSETDKTEILESDSSLGYERIKQPPPSMCSSIQTMHSEFGDEVELSGFTALKNFISRSLLSTYIPTKESDFANWEVNEEKRPMAIDLQKIHDNGYSSMNQSSYVEYADVVSKWILPSSPLRAKVNEILQLMQQIDWEMLRELHHMLRRAGKIDPVILSEFSFKLIDGALGKEKAVEFLEELNDDVMQSSVLFAKGLLNMYHECVPDSDDDANASNVHGARIPDDVKDYYNRKVEIRSPKSRFNANKSSGNAKHKSESTGGKTKNPSYAHVKSRYMDNLKKEAKSKNANHPIIKPKKKILANSGGKTGEKLPAKSEVFLPEPGSAMCRAVSKVSEISASSKKNEADQRKPFRPATPNSPKDIVREESQKSVSTQTSKKEQAVTEGETDTDAENLGDTESTEKTILKMLLGETKSKLIPGPAGKFTADIVPAENEVSLYDFSEKLRFQSSENTIERAIQWESQEQIKPKFSITDLYRLAPKLRPLILDKIMINVVLACALVITGQSLLPESETNHRGIICSISMSLRDKLRTLLIRALRLVDDF